MFTLSQIEYMLFDFPIEVGIINFELLTRQIDEDLNSVAIPFPLLFLHTSKVSSLHVLYAHVSLVPSTDLKCIHLVYFLFPTDL